MDNKTMNTQETINGLLSQKPHSPKPKAGEQRYLTWQTRTSAKGKEWIKVKNEGEEYGGKLCEIVEAEQTDFQDAHGNISFNVEFYPVVGGNGGGSVRPATAMVSEGKKEPNPATTPDNGLDETRHHLMQVANLYNLCVTAVDAVIAPNVPEALKTSEWLQAAVASLFIESSSRRSTDGVTWWSYVEKMPAKPISKDPF
jgi:hypothetical protein